MSIYTIKQRISVGGYTPFHLVSAATANLTLVKLGQSLLMGWSITNTNAAIRYIKFHDLSRVPVAGQNVYFGYGIPATGASNQNWGPDGIQFFNGLGISLVTGSAITDATSVASGDLIVNLFYQ